MKKVSLVVLFLSIFGAIQAQTGELKIVGVYQGKNLYVQNPFANSGVGFCVYEVRVNDQVTTDEVNSSAFEIDLLSFQLPIGAPLTIQIKHKEGCKPKVLNPEDVKPSATCSIVTINVDANAKLTWKTTGESGSLPFIIEQYRWNKWVKVGEVKGVGTAGEHNYNFNVDPHSGKNKIRIKQKDKVFQEFPFTSKVAQVNYAMAANGKELNFTNTTGAAAETKYEIFDQTGNIVSSGKASKVDITKLKPGTYYLNYDRSNAEIIIPKKR